MSVYVGIVDDGGVVLGRGYASLEPPIASHAHEEAGLHEQHCVGVAYGGPDQRLG